MGTPIESAEQWPLVAESVAGLLEGLRVAAIPEGAAWGFWDKGGQGRSETWSDYVLSVGGDDPTSRVAGWRLRLSEQPKHEAAFVDTYRLLERSVVDAVPRSLVHCDLSNRNAHAVDGHVTGVFDWGNSLYGDHLYDLAHFEFWQPWFPHIEEGHLRDLLFERWRSLNCVPPRFADRLGACFLHIGLEHLAYATFMQSEENFVAVHSRMKALVDGL